ncbi:MAG: ABC transporter substrate-binding protein [Lachnospiraceae bacterium]|nr:ABC transporter substrate-binding protein [Lachnospiraceae bacterium]
MRTNNGKNKGKGMCTMLLASALLLALLFSGCGKEPVNVRVGSLKGPTSMGLVALMDKAEKAKAQEEAGEEVTAPLKDIYDFTMETQPDALVGMMVKGDLDIALIPANVASILYQKTEGAVTVIDINTLSVLYIVSANTEIQSFDDLNGQTIYLTGKGTTPDYVLRYLLQKHGLSTDDVTLEYKSEATEVAAVLAQDEHAVGLLPQPFVTAACMQNDKLQILFDCGEEWDAVCEDGSSIVTGVTVVRNEFLHDHKDAVKNFLAEHKESAEFANTQTEETAASVVKYGILEKEPVAQKAIPYCNITYIDGAEMKQALTGYLQVLYDMEPESVGGALPGEVFYFE